jgi:hypothetical protein
VNRILDAGFFKEKEKLFEPAQLKLEDDLLKEIQEKTKINKVTRQERVIFSGTNSKRI